MAIFSQPPLTKWNTFFGECLPDFGLFGFGKGVAGQVIDRAQRPAQMRRFEVARQGF